MPPLFDMKLRALRRDRAVRLGPELFLLSRAFVECLERLMLVRRRFARALLIGCPNPEWPRQLDQFADELEIRDPGPLFARACGASLIVEDAWEAPAQRYDLVLSVGTLDTINDLPFALHLIQYAMAPEGLFLGALSGGETLPQLRRAMRAADVVAGMAAAHVHPRIEPSAVAPLLSQAGFIDPVVDVDRVDTSYATFARLIADLRAMAATSVLSDGGPPLSRQAAAAAAQAFTDAGDGQRTKETFEILHFAAWTPGHG